MAGGLERALGELSALSYILPGHKADSVFIAPCGYHAPTARYYMSCFCFLGHTFAFDPAAYQTLASPNALTNKSKSSPSILVTWV